MNILHQTAKRSFRPFYVLLLLCCVYHKTSAQSLLDRSISITADQRKLSAILKEISQKGNFTFSYNGRLVPQDSVVTLAIKNQPIFTILRQLFKDRFTFEERKNYVIITMGLRRLVLINTDLTTEQNTCSVSGIVADEQTGERLMNTSVYEKQQLASALTDEHGYFRLKFKMAAPGPISLTASKLLYHDTTLHLLQTVLVNSRNDRSAYDRAVDRTKSVERTGLGWLLISTRQMIQSMNITDFFASRPYQLSITPGLSTHGLFSSQVVNRFSLNLIGGYTAGVDGVEVGGLFNINKRDVRYLQLAGIFNLAGGNATGLQVAGAHNRVLDTVKGAQLSLFSNDAGAQLSGVQVSALHNRTHQLKGLQIGLVNVADTSYGASLGLLNFIGNGFYKVTYSASDISNMNVSLKTGTHFFYSELLTSANISGNKKFYSFGLGIGHDILFSDHIYLSAEANYQFANTGLWDDRWTQGKLLLNFQLSKQLSLIGGPTFNHYNHSGVWHIRGYKNVTNVPEFGDARPPDFANGNGHQTKNWIGWQFGLAFNSVFRPVKKITDSSRSWYLGIAATAGLAWDEPYGTVTGGELSIQRDLGENLTGTISSGYTHFGVLPRYQNGGSTAPPNVTLPVNIIPIKAGVRLKTGKRFYTAGEIGRAFGSRPWQTNFADMPNSHYSAFMYDIAAGFSFTNGLETGVKFEDHGLRSQYKQFAIRLGYRIKLSK